MSERASLRRAAGFGHAWTVWAAQWAGGIGLGMGLIDDEGLFTNLRGSRLELWDWVGDGDVWVR